MHPKAVDEVIGWYGTFAILIAYALLSFNLIQSNTLLYQGLNCTGALGIFFISIKKKAYQPGVLNIVWAIIAFIAIVSMLL